MFSVAFAEILPMEAATEVDERLRRVAACDVPVQEFSDHHEDLLKE